MPTPTNMYSALKTEMSTAHKAITTGLKVPVSDLQKIRDYQYFTKGRPVNQVFYDIFFADATVRHAPVLG